MELSVDRVQTSRDRREFIEFPKELYRDDSNFVPMFDIDMRTFLNRSHPYFAHVEVEFLLVRRSDTVVARGMVAKNDAYNRQHDTKCAHFYFVDFVDDDDVSGALFDAMAEWAVERGLDTLTGPLFCAATTGGGVLIKGHEFLPAMTMMGYNYPYYQTHYERVGFRKNFDLNSLHVDPATFQLPERVERLADRVRDKGRLKVVRLSSNREMKRLAKDVRAMYNPTLADHREGYPMTEAELDQVEKELLQIAHPLLEKVITYEGAVVGYMLGFPDLTPAIQKNRGKLGPIRILRLLRAKRRPVRLLLNGMGILEKYQRLGGNALIYSEIVKTVKDSGAFSFDDAEMVQINEETVLMLSDMIAIGAEVYKIHRVYSRPIGRAAG